jgi:hypothetical protein
MVPLPLISNGIVALVGMTLLLSSSWHCCPHCNGIVVIINVIALVAHCQAGIISLIVMALLPSMHRCLHRCCNGDCQSCHNGIVALVVVQASGVMHAYVDQKVLKSNKIKSFDQRPKHRV